MSNHLEGMAKLFAIRFLCPQGYGGTYPFPFQASLLLQIPVPGRCTALQSLGTFNALVLKITVLCNMTPYCLADRYNLLTFRRNLQPPSLDYKKRGRVLRGVGYDVSDYTV